MMRRVFSKMGACLVLGTVMLMLAPRPSVVCSQPGQDGSFAADDSLQVHAIAWSEDPAARVAVIGDQVLHEGMSGHGFELLQIKVDRVELRINGTRITREIARLPGPPPSPPKAPASARARRKPWRSSR